MRRLGSFLLLTALALMTFGCRESGLQVGGTPPAQRYQTAVSLSPSAFELLRSKVMGTTVVGRTAQCNWPAISGDIPVVMNGVKPNYEKIAQIHPGIVVYDDLLFSPADVEKIKQLGFETFVIKGDTIEEFIECLYDLGRTFHSETYIMDYVENIRSAAATAAGAPPAKNLKVAVIMPGQGSEHMIAGADSFIADAVRTAQATPVGPKGNQFVPVSAETLVQLNPDAIVASSDPKSLLNDPRLQSISAIRNGKVAKIKDPDILLRRGGRVDKLIISLHQFFSKASHE